MAKALRINGRAARLGTRRVTDANGAPCCCGGGCPCPPYTPLIPIRYAILGCSNPSRSAISVSYSAPVKAAQEVVVSIFDWSSDNGYWPSGGGPAFDPFVSGSITVEETLCAVATTAGQLGTYTYTMVARGSARRRSGVVVDAQTLAESGPLYAVGVLTAMIQSGLPPLGSVYEYMAAPTSDVLAVGLLPYFPTGPFCGTQTIGDNTGGIQVVGQAVRAFGDAPAGGTFTVSEQASRRNTDTGQVFGNFTLSGTRTWSRSYSCPLSGGTTPLTEPPCPGCGGQIDREALGL